MRVIKTNTKEHKGSLPTTKTAVVIDIYKDATEKTVAKRLVKIEHELQDIIQDKTMLKDFLRRLEKELKRKPSIPMKTIIKMANKEINQASQK